MFPFSSKDQKNQPQEANAGANKAPKAHEVHPLDELTGGIFSAATSGERAQRVRDWIAQNPTIENMQEVFKELSAKDKGAAKALREKLDEVRRAKGQEALVFEWESKAKALLDGAKLNIADALAWQRDAAKAGAPLSKEPLGALRTQLTERIKSIEDLEKQLMVQREAAVMLAQRIELLATKSFLDAKAQHTPLAEDVVNWRENAGKLPQHAEWQSLDVRYPVQLETVQNQLIAVWQAFDAAHAQTLAAQEDVNAPLPLVPFWAEEIKKAREEALAAEQPAKQTEKPVKQKIDPEQKQAAQKAVEAGAMLLEKSVSEGNTKNMHSAAQALRQSLKTHGRLIDDALEARVHAALISAGELEGWQRWSADKVREQLVARAEALLAPRKKSSKPTKSSEQDLAETTEENAEEVVSEVLETSEAAQEIPQEATQQATQEVSQGVAQEASEEKAALPVAQAAVAPEMAPTMGGRKLQEAIRKLREEWKAADQGGAPNQALWKRFDRACNEAHKFVDEWLVKVRAQTAQSKELRLALIEEVKQWGIEQAEKAQSDWRAFNRQVHQFADRWRNAGHLSEKAYAEMQQVWKETLQKAAAPLEKIQQESIKRRQEFIEQSKELASAASLRIDAVKQLQAQWQAEAQTVPLDRKLENRLWDAFRAPLDEAFSRKSSEREKHSAAMSAHDKAVLEAVKALEEALSSADAQKILEAKNHLEAITRGEVKQEAEQVAENAQAPAEVAESAQTPEQTAEGAGEQAAQEATEEKAEVAEPVKVAKPLIAMRGDDRPNAQRPDAAKSDKFDKRGRDSKDARRSERGDRLSRDGGRDGKFERVPRAPRAPRLGDAAFKAQREAMEQAQNQLKKLAAQAHGEVVVKLMSAWAARDAEQVPTAQELGKGVTGSTRTTWAEKISQPAKALEAEAMLRLEMAAEVPTPAEHLPARKMLQLKLLTTKNREPMPIESWTQDAAKVLSGAHDEKTAQRLQNALKILMRK